MAQQPRRAARAGAPQPPSALANTLSGVAPPHHGALTAHLPEGTPRPGRAARAAAARGPPTMRAKSQGAATRRANEAASAPPTGEPPQSTPPSRAAGPRSKAVLPRPRPCALTAWAPDDLVLAAPVEDETSSREEEADADLFLGAALRAA